MESNLKKNQREFEANSDGTEYLYRGVTITDTIGINQLKSCFKNSRPYHQNVGRYFTEDRYKIGSTNYIVRYENNNKENMVIQRILTDEEVKNEKVNNKTATASAKQGTEPKVADHYSELYKYTTETFNDRFRKITKEDEQELIRLFYKGFAEKTKEEVERIKEIINKGKYTFDTFFNNFIPKDKSASKVYQDLKDSLEKYGYDFNTTFEVKSPENSKKLRELIDSIANDKGIHSETPFRKAESTPEQQAEFAKEPNRIVDAFNERANTVPRTIFVGNFGDEVNVREPFETPVDEETLKKAQELRKLSDIENNIPFQRFTIPVKDLDSRKKAMEEVSKLIADYKEEIDWDEDLGLWIPKLKNDKIHAFDSEKGFVNKEGEALKKYNKDFFLPKNEHVDLNLHTTGEITNTEDIEALFCEQFYKKNGSNGYDKEAIKKSVEECRKCTVPTVKPFDANEHMNSIECEGKPLDKDSIVSRALKAAKKGIMLNIDGLFDESEKGYISEDLSVPPVEEQQRKQILGDILICGGVSKSGVDFNDEAIEKEAAQYKEEKESIQKDIKSAMDSDKPEKDSLRKDVFQQRPIIGMVGKGGDSISESSKSLINAPSRVIGEAINEQLGIKKPSDKKEEPKEVPIKKVLSVLGLHNVEFVFEKKIRVPESFNEFVKKEIELVETYTTDLYAHIRSIASDRQIYIYVNENGNILVDGAIYCAVA